MKRQWPGLLLLLVLLPGSRAFQEPPEFDASASEMRPAIERFAADRAILGRAYSDSLAPSRQARFKQFYSEW